MKIDVFTHVLPSRYFARMEEVAPGNPGMGKRVRNIPVLYDMERRLAMLREFGDDYRQIISLAVPPLETFAGPDVTPGLARLGNDEMAELVRQHPERLAGFVAGLPLNEPQAAADEARRAIGALGALGVQIYTNAAGRPLDDDDFLPVWEAVAECGRPVWLHPSRDAGFADYASESKSKYEIWWALGWPYETSVAMARLVFSGLLDRFPELPILTHHLGGIVPYLEGRVGPGWDQLGSRTSDEDLTGVRGRLRKPVLEYFKGFYADTAMFGATAATRCGLEFFGVDHVLFASDSPFDPEKGPRYIRETIRIIDRLPITTEEREKIYQGNIERLLGKWFA